MRALVHTQRTGCGLLPITKRGKSALCGGVRVKPKLCAFVQYPFSFSFSSSPHPFPLSLSPPLSSLRSDIRRGIISLFGNTNGLLRGRKISRWRNHTSGILSRDVSFSGAPHDVTSARTCISAVPRHTMLRRIFVVARLIDSVRD